MGLPDTMINCLSVVLILLVMVTICPSSKASKTEHHDFCMWETFKASCEADQVIVINHARYGRMKQGRCVQNNLGYIGCSKDVQDIMDARCSGKHSCEVQLPDPVLDKLQPCINDLKSYLEVSYECVDVWRPQQEICRATGNVILTSQEGYIANVITDETGCGSKDSPWRIQAEPGQTVELHFLDFSGMHSVDYTDTRNCPVYATVKEESKNAEKVLCGGRGRDYPAYTSTGNALEISIPVQPKGTEGNYFVMHYKVVGCANPKLPSHLKFERKGKIGLATCTHSDEYWHLRCDGMHWKGHIGNCSVGGQVSSNGQMALGSISLPTGLTITIIVGVSLLIGSSILLVGLVCLKFCRNQRRDEERKRRRDVEEILYDTSSKRPLSSMTVSLANSSGTERRAISRMREANDYACIWEWPPESGIHYGFHGDTTAGLYATKQECQLCSVQDPLCAQPLTATCIPEDGEDSNENEYRTCQSNCMESVEPGYYELDKKEIEAQLNNIKGSPDILPYKPQSQPDTFPEVQDL